MSEPAAPAFVPGDRPRFERVPLDWPVEYAGKVYKTVTVRRMSLADVRAFVGELKDAAEITHLPVFIDDEGEAVPPVVLDALDPDDDDVLDEAVARFLPRRFRAALESGQGSETGGGSEPT